MKEVVGACKDLALTAAKYTTLLQHAMNRHVFLLTVVKWSVYRLLPNHGLNVVRFECVNQHKQPYSGACDAPAQRRRTVGLSSQ